MASIVSGYEYDIFISYRQKDNKYDGWVTEFVNNLRKELDATFKEEISIYFDANPEDGLLEIHSVDKSLVDKLKCLIFIPIISQTYCDPKSFAWAHEFCAFNKLAKADQFGRDIKFSNTNVASRILPVKIHDLDPEDKKLFENELGGVLRAVEFIYKEAGVNRPLKPSDNKYENINKTDYRNQVNKVANAIKEIIGSLKKTSSPNIETNKLLIPVSNTSKSIFEKTGNRSTIVIILISVIIISITTFLLKKYYFSKENSIFIFVPFSILIIAGLGFLFKNLYFSNRASEVKYNNKITVNPVAYDWYKKAEFRLTPEDNCDIESCIFFLKKAIDADSSFALAHAELSQAYSFKNYFIDPNGRYDEKAFVEAEKSLYLNPGLAEGYFAKAYCTWTFQNKFPHERVIREYKKSISLKPDLDKAHHYLGVVYMHVGLMTEAINAIIKAVQINSDNKIASLDLITCYFFKGKKTDLEHAIDLYKQTPDHLISSMRASFWAIAYITLDRSIEAERILSSGLNKNPSDLFINSAMAILLAKKGDKNGALERIEYCEKNNLSTGHYHHAVYNLAVAYGWMESFQVAVDKLTWVADNGFPNYLVFRDDLLLKPLQNFRPYNDLLKKLKTLFEKFSRLANK